MCDFRRRWLDLHRNAEFDRFFGQNMPLVTVFIGFAAMVFARVAVVCITAFGGAVWAQSPPNAPKSAAAASSVPLVLPANLAPAGTAAYVAPSPISKPAVKTPGGAPRPKPVAARPVSAASSAQSDDASAGARAVGKIIQPPSETPVKGEISAQKVVRDASGKEQFEPATNLVLGDIIQFNATFTNMNPIAIKFDPQISIPADTALIAGSIQPPQGRLVKLASGDRVVWAVPHLPPVTWVGASMRVRYTRAADPAPTPTTPPLPTPTTSPIVVEPPLAASSAPAGSTSPSTAPADSSTPEPPKP